MRYRVVLVKHYTFSVEVHHSACPADDSRLPNYSLYYTWLTTQTAVTLGLGSNPGEDMDVCKCIVPPRQGGTLNSHRAASHLGRLVEVEERWETPDHPQGVLPLNWGETELNRSVTCMVLKATANDRRHLAHCHD
ncbi:cullin-4A [Trichonephila clavipes]|nr:cullin-4A [Trichonephila clavipes]